MPHRPAKVADHAARLLLVDAAADAREAMASVLAQCLLAPRIDMATSGRDGSGLLRAGGYDIVLADLATVEDIAATIEESVSRLARLAQGALLIMLSAEASVSAAVAAMRAGAHDVVAKPVNGAAFAARIGELAQRHGKVRGLTLGGNSARHPGFAGFAGASSQMQFVYEQIERIAASAAPVFITGESGTGKETCAEALHTRGPRARRHYVALDCGSIPRDELEAELFGVASGAMTGTDADRPGAAEFADGGTLFLDEIGEMELSLQGKLFRFLQTGGLSRIGDAEVRQVDVRVICATSRNPMQLIAEKKFREDLFYRLHVLPIHLPPLRQRPTDILVLARNFLERYAGEEHKVFGGFSAEAASALVAHDWPGNVRQLQNLVRRIVVMFDGGDVSAAMIASADIESLALVHEPAIVAGPGERAVLPLWRQEQKIIEEAIESFAGNIALAAAALEVSPSTIYRKRQAWAEGTRGAA